MSAADEWHKEWQHPPLSPIHLDPSSSEQMGLGEFRQCRVAGGCELAGTGEDCDVPPKIDGDGLRSREFVVG